jgi:alpha-galactosidase
MISQPATPAFPDRHVLGFVVVRYERCPLTGVVEFSCHPLALDHLLATPRVHDAGPHLDHLPARWLPQRSHEPEWLVQVKLADTPEPGGHQAGRSLRGAPELRDLTCVRHQRLDSPSGEVRIETDCAHPRGFLLRHVLAWSPGQAFFTVHTEFHNTGPAPLTVEYLPSFSLGGITPFHPGEAPGRLHLHRFRTAWSAEGRHERLALEALHLERSWTGFSRRTERYGQLGSLPVRGFFPWIGVEDSGVGALWGAQLSAPASWHLELSRLKDRVILSGGLPSRDFGDWWRTVAPGEILAAPPAALACVAGDIDHLCHALLGWQRAALEDQPAIERDLPPAFNEWCSSWGSPTHDHVVATARRLAASTRTRYLVIDDGWAAKPPGRDIQFNGDWIVDRAKFPGGLRATADAIRALGLVPGLWFELEAATEGTEAFADESRHLRRAGRVVQVGPRRFWDLRDPVTVELLAQKVIARLRDDGFGYLKIDYNDTLPAGLDGAESPGAGLLAQIDAVLAFLRRVRRELPDLVIENCSSGGHRLVPAFQSLCAQASFSDAHETVAIPIIAAALHRLVLPAQSQIWCVLHREDSPARLRYGLAATLLGRMVLSGDLAELQPWQIDLVCAAQDFYAACVHVLRDGASRLHSHAGPSWNEPRGWQALVRATSTETLVVLHAFADAPAGELSVPLPPGEWRIEQTFGADASGAGLEAGDLILPAPGAFDAAALRLVRA